MMGALARREGRDEAAKFGQMPPRSLRRPGLFFLLRCSFFLENEVTSAS